MLIRAIGSYYHVCVTIRIYIPYFGYALAEEVILIAYGAKQRGYWSWLTWATILATWLSRKHRPLRQLCLP